MSEYQYYEFQAIDSPLAEREQRELRAISSRATITATRFANSYSWGDLKANPGELVERYFDAHLYLANWGTRALTFRFPRRLLDLEIAKRHCRGGAASARGKGDHVIVDFSSEEEASDWDAEDEGPGHLAALLPVRSEVASADLRALYLGWLLCAQNGDLADADEEPPCPPGLRALSAPLEAMIDFLRIDRDLVDAAAAGSADAGIAPRHDIEQWVAALPEKDRTALLVRLVQGGDPHLHSEMVRRFRASTRSGSGLGVLPPRTAGQLLAEAERRRTERERAEAEQAARERARHEREAAEARARELDALGRREAEAWAEVAAHIATKQPQRYDQAVMLLRDLRDLGARRGHGAAVEARIERLCDEHAKKPSFVRRVRSALARPTLG